MSHYPVLNRIKIVMVNTTLSLNIGSAGRAMKTMGLSQLCLVSPKEPIGEHAIAVSAGASDILESAHVVETLEDAIADCQLVFATSSRKRSIPWALLELREASHIAIQELQHNLPTDPSFKIAIIFGREDRGLTNEELALAHYHLTIPANPIYPVLNIASSIQLVCYELMMACNDLQLAPPSKQARNLLGDRGIHEPDSIAETQPISPKVNQASMEEFFDHLEAMLVHIEFLDKDNPRLMPLRLRRLFGRMRLDKVEYNLLRGIIGKVLSVTGGTWSPKSPKQHDEA